MSCRSFRLLQEVGGNIRRSVAVSKLTMKRTWLFPLTWSAAFSNLLTTS